MKRLLVAAVALVGCGERVSGADASLPPIDVGWEASCAPPSEPRPEQTLRSCTGPDGAPREHCREVWGCGGRFSMGSLDASMCESTLGTLEVPATCRPMDRNCDLGEVIARPGFIDAYEVSVARFRAWVRAGRPIPPPGEFIPPNYTYTATAEGMSLPLRTDDLLPRDGEPQPQYCTYRETPGPNDNLPINCLGWVTASAFCWWEGKHLVSEAMWEWFATNGGRTTLPFSDRLQAISNLCAYGDVGRHAECPGEGLFPAPIDAFPLGQTTTPPGVFGLWGGVRELVWTARDTSVGRCLRATPLNPDERTGTRVVNRGRSFADVGAAATAYDDSRTRAGGDRNINMRWVGFRCARWVPEVPVNRCTSC